MDRRINPFSELYLTETIPLAQFVKIFSPYAIQIAEELFLPGNVVLKGVQGCGKSMLLTLLKPELRVAYERAKHEFPLHGKHSMFVGAGINLTRSRAIAIGQRRITNSDDAQTLSLVFADFLNYWIVDDLFKSLETLSGDLNGKIAHDLNICYDEEHLARTTRELVRNPAWLGYLDGCRTFGDLRQRIADRIQCYFRFFQFIGDLPQQIHETRSAIGEPISTTAEILSRCAVVPEDVHIFVRIDQYEELAKIEAQFNQGQVYRAIVHKLLAQRDPHVSYRIGTRSYGFKEGGLSVFGTTATLERDRNYKVINLDELLRRHENRKTWAFPKFAEDVFRKRMQLAEFDVPEGDSIIELVFGKGSAAEEKASKYCRNNAARALRLDPAWPDEWARFLRHLAEKDPLSARLGEAWARQKDKRAVVHNIPLGPYPWDGKTEKPYWRKERVEAALMQIASRCNQRMIWGGKDDVIALSGGNILVFVGICQRIWSVWLRTVNERDRRDSSLPKIDEALQAVGIHEASTNWFEKLCEESEGNKRQRFVRYLGILLQRKLLEDGALSYPGANGFSLNLEERDRYPDVWDFLDDAVDYGALFDAPHTTKESNRRPRRKWYLNPILSPYFRLPHVRTKEPWYVSTQQVASWIEASVYNGADEPTGNHRSNDAGEVAGQPLLFPEHERGRV